MEESINKIITIGKVGSCTLKQLLYFLPNYPITNGSEFVFSKKIFRIAKDLENRLEYFVKGLHFIELKYRILNRNKWGFGHPSCTFHIILNLYQSNPKLSDSLGEWIAYNGGNYYIDSCNIEKEKCIPSWRLTKNQLELLFKQLVKEGKINNS